MLLHAIWDTSDLLLWASADRFDLTPLPAVAVRRALDAALGRSTAGVNAADGEAPALEPAAAPAGDAPSGDAPNDDAPNEKAAHDGDDAPGGDAPGGDAPGGDASGVDPRAGQGSLNDASDAAPVEAVRVNAAPPEGVPGDPASPDPEPSDPEAVDPAPFDPSPFDPASPDAGPDDGAPPDVSLVADTGMDDTGMDDADIDDAGVADAPVDEDLPAAVHLRDGWIVLPTGEVACTFVVVPPIDALDLFGQQSSGDAGRGTGPGGGGGDFGRFTVSDSYLFYRRLSRLVVAALAGQQFYPSMKQTDAGHVATWQVLVGDQTAVAQLEQYAQAMPPAARALEHLGEAHPLRLVETFLTETTDALARRAVMGDSFFDRVHIRPAASDVRWLSALLGRARRIDGETGELRQLNDAIQIWLTPLTHSGASEEMKLGFKLLEPEGEGEQWPVEFVLIDAADEGTDPLAEEAELPAAALWKQEAGAMTSLGRGVRARQERFVAELRRASEAFPSLERVIHEPAPHGVLLTPVEAYAFMRNWSRALEEMQFGVQMPSWAEQEMAELSLRMSLVPADDDGDFLSEPGHAGGQGPGQPFTAGGRVGLDAIVRFDWRIAVGDLQLTAAEFEAVVARQSPLVKFNGRWVPVDLEAAQKASDAIKQTGTGRLTLGDAFRRAYGLAGEAGVPVSGLTGADWIGRLLDQAPDEGVSDLPQPAGFLGELRPYQLRGLRWLEYLDRLGLGACLADDMGLGKTIQFIALLLHERLGNPECGPTLLFAPASVLGNWMRELQRFAPDLKVMPHHGPERSHGDAFVEQAMRHHVVITGYALAHRDLEDFKRVLWRRVALDEAQKVKNPSSAASQSIRSIASSRRVALTGTPIENHLSELWAIMETLNPGLLGSPSQFRERFVLPIEKMADRSRGALLRELIRPFVLRRTKQDGEVAANLPEKMEMRVYCSLTPEQAAMYERVTGEMLSSVENASGIRRRGLILAGLTRLKQICDHPALLTPDNSTIDNRSGKSERLVDMLEEVLEEGEAALVFTQYREMGHLLEKLIAARLNQPTLFLHGGVPVKQRDDMVEQFQSGKTAKIFILSLRAGGLGLNLTAASHVFHYDRWWNPAVEAQATDRAHRIGQSRIVQVHKFVSIGTVEERIDKLLTEKLSLAESIVTSGDGWLTNLSTEDLRSYVALSGEAVEE